MTFAATSLRVITFGGPLLLAATLEDGRIQIQTEAIGRDGEQRQKPAPERAPERLDVGLGEAEEKVANRVITGETLQAQQGVQDAVGPEPFAVGEALRADHHGHEEGDERVGQRDGVVGGRFGKRQTTLDLRGKADGAEEGDETGESAEGRDGLGRFVQNQLGIAKEGGNFGAGRFVQGGRGLFKHQSLCPQAPAQRDPFSCFGVRVNPYASSKDEQ